MPAQESKSSGGLSAENVPADKTETCSELRALESCFKDQSAVSRYFWQQRGQLEMGPWPSPCHMAGLSPSLTLAYTEGQYFGQLRPTHRDHKEASFRHVGTRLFQLMLQLCLHSVADAETRSTACTLACGGPPNRPLPAERP